MDESDGEDGDSNDQCPKLVSSPSEDDPPANCLSR